MDQDPKPSTSRGFALGQSTDTDASNEAGRSTFTGAEFSSSTEGGRSNSSDLGSSSSSSPSKHVASDLKKYKVDKQYLRSRLSAVAYEVTQEKGTELPFSGDLVHTNSAGVYYCLICDAELFSSKSKYDASCGWPSFYDAIDQSRVVLTPDHTASRNRTEVSCARCDAHLGHFFQKESTPTGNRYCINSCALVFRKADDCVQPDSIEEEDPERAEIALRERALKESGSSSD